MPWWIKHSAPSVSSSVVAQPSMAPLAPASIGEFEARTVEAEQLMEKLAKRVAELEGIAAGRVKPGKRGAELKENKLTYFWDHSSPSCQGPALFLQKVGIHYKEKVFQMDDRLVHTNREDKENCEINYNHAVPSLDDGGFGVFESHAILRYLAEKFCPNSHWYPDDLQTRTRINMYLDWHAYTIRAAFVIIGLAFLPAHSKEGLDKDKAYLQLVQDTLYGSQSKLWSGRADNGVVAQLRIINDKWLGKSAFIAGSQPSIADISLYADAGYLLHMFNVDFKLFPRVNDWYQKMDKEFGGLNARKQYIPYMEVFAELFREFLPAPPAKGATPQQSSIAEVKADRQLQPPKTQQSKESNRKQTEVKSKSRSREPSSSGKADVIHVSHQDSLSLPEVALAAPSPVRKIQEGLGGNAEFNASKYWKEDPTYLDTENLPEL